MLKFILFFFLAFSLQISNCGVNRGNLQAKNSFVGRRNNYMGHNIPTTTTAIAPLTPKEFLQVKGTFSAFTLILVIISATIFGLGFYYTVICYPLLCRTEKNYQFMDVSSTITSATSRSIQSIENFPTGKSLENYPTSEKSNETFPSCAPIITEKHLSDNFIHHPDSPAASQKI